MVRFRQFLTENPQTDILVSQAAESVVQGIKMVLKKNMTRELFLKLAANVDKSELKVHNFPEMMIGYNSVGFMVNVHLNKILGKSNWPRSNEIEKIKNLSVAFVPGSSEPGEKVIMGKFFVAESSSQIVINVFALQFITFREESFTNFYRVVDYHHETLIHELTHWFDNIRIKGKRIGLASQHDQTDKFGKYYNSTEELNARYQSAINFVFTDMHRYMAGNTLARTFAHDEWNIRKMSTPRKFIEIVLSLENAEESQHLSIENKKRLEKRLYKLYDFLADMPPDDFKQLIMAGLPTKLRISYIKKAMNL